MNRYALLSDYDELYKHKITYSCTITVGFELWPIIWYMTTIIPDYDHVIRTLSVNERQD